MCFKNYNFFLLLKSGKKSVHRRKKNGYFTHFYQSSILAFLKSQNATLLVYLVHQSFGLEIKVSNAKNP